MNYKKGDPVRVKADGSMWYFREIDIDDRCVLFKYESLKGEALSTFLDKIEPLLLRHPYYGKLVSVWDSTERLDSCERIFLDKHGDMIMVVGIGWEGDFKNGINYYKVECYDHWEPLPEEPQADPAPTPEELAAFEKVRSYFDRISK